MRYNFSLSRFSAWEISMLVLSGKGELMLIHGGIKNNYKHNILVMNSYELASVAQTADDVNVRDNVHSHLCHAKRPMAVSFLTPTPPPQNGHSEVGKFPTFEGPVFEVENIGLALCQYVTAAGSLFNCSLITEESTGASETKMTWNTCYET